MDGKRTKTTNDLLLEFKKKAPNTKVKIAYMIRTNLGWMGNGIVATLGPTPEQN